MVIKELVYYEGRAFNRCYSDSGYMIERDGLTYIEAVDPVEFNREYTETYEKIPDSMNEITDTEALNIITGRDTDESQNSAQTP